MADSIEHKDIGGETLEYYHQSHHAQKPELVGGLKRNKWIIFTG